MFIGKENMKKIFVYGGCVSRDTFNEPYNKGMLSLVSYIARYSLAKLASKSISITIDSKNLPSAFQRRMVEVDAKNKLLSNLKEKEFDYLLIDFLFIRFPLVEIKSGLLTYSSELKKTKLVTSKNRIISVDSAEYSDLFYQGLDMFIDFLRDNNLLNKLIVNKIYLAKVDSNGASLGDEGIIDRQNNFLKKIYDYLSTKINASQFLKYDYDLFIGAAEHQWGRSPMHYISSFYENCYEKLCEI